MMILRNDFGTDNPSSMLYYLSFVVDVEPSYCPNWKPTTTMKIVDGSCWIWVILEGIHRSDPVDRPLAK